MTRDDVIREARALCGTPFHHQARLPGVGIDCVGVGVCVARALGIAVIDSNDYPRRPNRRDPDRLLQYLRLNLDPSASPIPGDVLAFTYRDTGLVYHIGIMTDIDRMVHAWVGGRKVIEAPLSDWAGSLHSSWCFRGLA